MISLETTLTPATAQAYNKAWSLFARWADSAGVPASAPVTPETLAAYVRCWPATLGRSGRKLRLAGLAHGHRRAGLPWRDRDPVMGALLRASETDEAALLRQLNCCSADLAGLRDRTLLLLQHRAGLNRIQIAALDHADLRWSGGELTIVLQDADGARSGLPVARRRDDPPCLMSTLETWLHSARIRHGPVIPRLGSHGWPEGRLDRRGIRLLLQAIDRRVAATTPPPGRAPVAGAWRTANHRKTVRARAAATRKAG